MPSCLYLVGSCSEIILLRNFFFFYLNLSYEILICQVVHFPVNPFLG